MAYKVVTSFYEGNILHEEGTIFDHKDTAYVQKCLADGNIAEVSKGGSESTTPLAATPPASESPEPEVAVVEEVQPPQPSQPTPEQIDETLSSLDGSPTTSNEDQTS